MGSVELILITEINRIRGCNEGNHQKNYMKFYEISELR